MRKLFVGVLMFLSAFAFTQDFDSAYREFDHGYNFVDQHQKLASEFDWFGPTPDTEVYFDEGATLIFSKDKSVAIFIQYLSDRVIATYAIKPFLPKLVENRLRQYTAEMCLDLFACTGITNDYIVYTTFK